MGSLWAGGGGVCFDNSFNIMTCFKALDLDRNKRLFALGREVVVSCLDNSFDNDLVQAP